MTTAKMKFLLGYNLKLLFRVGNEPLLERVYRGYFG